MKGATREERQKIIRVAEGLTRMAGSQPPPLVFQLLERYIDGAKSLDDVREEFKEMFFQQHPEVERDKDLTARVPHTTMRGQ